MSSTLCDQRMARRLLLCVCLASVALFVNASSSIRKESSSHSANVLAGTTASAPEQFHIAYTNVSNEMWVSWAITPSAASTNPVCQFSTLPVMEGTPHSAWIAQADTTTYKDGACNFSSCVPWDGTLHSARLKGLPYSTRIFYRCGDDESGWSRVYSFMSAPDPDNCDIPVSFIALGDIGYSENAAAVRDDILARGADADFFLAIGDVSYANGNQTGWDLYGRLWEPVYSQIPSLHSPGNHDGEWRYGNTYDYESVGGGDSGIAFAMRYPGPGPVASFDSKHTGNMESTSFWWSVNYGPAHILATSGVHEFGAGSEQYRFIENDLREAAKPENREKRPWIIVTNHYPMYATLADCFCNYTAGATCQDPGSFFPGVLEVTANLIKDNLEPLLLRYNVDVFLSGHEHAYERTFPVKNMQATDTSSLHYYKNPQAPVHVMAGTGGGDPDTKWLPKHMYAWSAVRSDDQLTDTKPFGWLRVSMADKTKMAFQYLNVASSAAEYVRDEFVIEKDVTSVRYF